MQIIGRLARGVGGLVTEESRPAELDDQVLRLLAPLTAAYVERAGPAVPRHQPVEHEAPSSGGAEFRSCLLRAVVAIDPEGRVPWRFLEGPDRHRATAIDVAEGMIRVTVGGRAGARLVQPDRQGRLKVPQGLLRAAGLHLGDRIAVVQLEGSVFALAPPTRLALRIAAA